MRKLLRHLANLAIFTVIVWIAYPYLSELFGEWTYDAAYCYLDAIRRDQMRVIWIPPPPWTLLPTRQFGYYALMFGPLVGVIAIWAAVRLLFKKRPCGM